MKTMTAVEWLVKEFSKHYSIHQLEYEIEQADKIFKQQIMDAHIDGQPIYSCQSEKAEQYYNETYDKKNG